jgi:protein associated with RNAse G/E
VVRGWTGRVWVDDEDEFADHRVRYAYPPDLVRLAVTSCDEVRAAVDAGRPPYDGEAPRRWFETLTDATGRWEG